MSATLHDFPYKQVWVRTPAMVEELMMQNEPVEDEPFSAIDMLLFISDLLHSDNLIIDGIQEDILVT